MKGLVFVFQGLGTECADGEEIHQAKFTQERYCVFSEVVPKCQGALGQLSAAQMGTALSC